MSGARRKPGQLGAYVDGYRSFLLAFGYTPETVRGLLKVLGQLGRWMAERGLTPAEFASTGSRNSSRYRVRPASSSSACLAAGDARR